MTCDPSTPTIREATQQDAAAIARLAEDAGMGTLTPRGTSYVALDGDRIVGFIRIVEAEGDRYVSPSWWTRRRAGWAWDARSCRTLGHATARCCSSHAARRFRSTRRWDASR